MKIDFKKIVFFFTRLSKARFVGYALFLLVIFSLAAITWDMFIFFSYYRIAVESASPAPISQLQVSQQNLEEVLKIISPQ